MVAPCTDSMSGIGQFYGCVWTLRPNPHQNCVCLIDKTPAWLLQSIGNTTICFDEMTVMVACDVRSKAVPVLTRPADLSVVPDNGVNQGESALTRRICETCRFFKAAGFDSMGWCEHPKRRLSSEIKILARSQEIQCRNEWNRDLWQHADEAREDIAISSTVSPLVPATADEVSFAAGASLRLNSAPPGSDPAASSGEDVVVGEVTSSFAGTGSRGERGRDSLRRAHEELKLRKRESRSMVSPLMGLGESVQTEEVANSAIVPSTSPRSADGEVIVNDQDAPKPRTIIGDVSPVELGEMGRPFPKMTTFPDEVDRFSTIPAQVEGFDLPLANKTEPRRVVRRAGFDIDDRELTAWSSTPGAAVEHVPADTARLPSGTGSQRESLQSVPLSRVHSDPDVSPAPIAQDIHESVDLALFAESQDFGQEAPPRRLPRESRPIFEQAVRTPIHREPAIDNGEVQIEVRTVRRHASAEIPVPLEEESNAGPVHAHVSPYEDRILEPVVNTIESPEYEASPASAIPRMCRTCRDFRPAENGDRGWCTNKWAFSHRRMVDADELPCETSIGGWWLPHDDLWLSAIDVSTHGQPTPLLDSWLAARSAAIGDIDDSPSVRRRQRS